MASDTKREFLGGLCNLYMIVLVLILPLYTGGSYYRIGDSKYSFFQNVSLLCLGVWIVIVVISAVAKLAVRIRRRVRHGQFRGGYRIEQYCSPICGMRWSTVDICIISYGICALLSAMASPYGTTAWLGYRDWYMGAISQMLFVGIYFFVSREYAGQAYPIYLGEMGLLLVVALAFLQRCGVDPLKLHMSFQATDWEYSHMLSTVGNINWLCGYLSVLLPWPVIGYLYSKRGWKLIVCYVISVLALALTLTQGSDVGMVLTVACLGLGFLYGIKRREFFRRSILLALGVCVLCPITGYLMRLLETQEMLAADGFVTEIMTKSFWWILAIVLLGIYFLQRVLPGKITAWLNKFLLIGGLVFAVLFVVIYLCGLPEGSAWGSGRGGLWQAAWKGFCRMDWNRKLWGVGPDCFAEYIYGIPALAELIQVEDHWADSIFANAHNEWLNLVVNGGVIGVAAYASIFVCSLRRYRGMMLGVMVLVLYGINSVFSFQQVMSTPLLFLVLGICESRHRKVEYAEEQFI